MASEPTHTVLLSPARSTLTIAGPWRTVKARLGVVTLGRLGWRGHPVVALAACVLVGIVCPSLAGAYTSSSGPGNLLVNGAAEEAGVGVPGWAGTQGYTTTAYGAPGEYPSLAVSESMGSLGGGARFFDPGSVTTATLTQMVDLSAYAAAIDADQQAIDFGGWLGGYGSSPDTVDMVVTPLDSSGSPISAPWVLYGPTATQREDPR
jgi:hypothetical protein